MTLGIFNRLLTHLAVGVAVLVIAYFLGVYLEVAGTVSKGPRNWEASGAATFLKSNPIATAALSTFLVLNIGIFISSAIDALTSIGRSLANQAAHLIFRLRCRKGRLRNSEDETEDTASGSGSTLQVRPKWTSKILTLSTIGLLLGITFFVILPWLDLAPARVLRSIRSSANTVHWTPISKFGFAGVAAWLLAALTYLGKRPEVDSFRTELTNKYEPEDRTIIVCPTTLTPSHVTALLFFLAKEYNDTKSLLLQVAAESSKTKTTSPLRLPSELKKSYEDAVGTKPGKPDRWYKSDLENPWFHRESADGIAIGLALASGDEATIARWIRIAGEWKVAWSMAVLCFASSAVLLTRVLSPNDDACETLQTTHFEATFWFCIAGLVLARFSAKQQLLACRTAARQALFELRRGTAQAHETSSSSTVPNADSDS